MEQVPWDRNDEETSRQYAAFSIYRNLGPGRSLIEAEIIFRREMDGDERADRLAAVRNTSATFSRWNRQHDWRGRAESWDAFLEAQERKVLKAERLKAASRHAKQASELSSVLAHPVGLLADRVRQIAEGKHDDELAKLSDEELFDLVRSGARAMLDAQKSEREALVSADDEHVEDDRLVARGDLVKRILGDRSSRAVLERLVIETPAPDHPSDIRDADTGGTRYLSEGQTG